MPESLIGKTFLVVAALTVVTVAFALSLISRIDRVIRRLQRDHKHVYEGYGEPVPLASALEQPNAGPVIATTRLIRDILFGRLVQRIPDTDRVLIHEVRTVRRLAFASYMVSFVIVGLGAAWIWLQN